MPPKRMTTGSGEKRVDPYDNKQYTFEELTRAYRNQYTPSQIKEYWQKEMSPVESDECAAPSSHDQSAPQAREGAVGSASELPKVTFCPDPKTVGGRFTATYEKDPPLNFASVNPGDQGLKVGGSTLNGQFAQDLYNFGWQQTDKYASFHNKLFSNADIGKFTAASPDLLAANPNLQAAFVRKVSDAKVSCVFVDIFKPDVCVHGNAKNMGMVYAVGPRRQDCRSDADFLTQVEIAADNISRACSEYNSAVAETSGPRIEILRVPLVSGGAFAGKCPKDAVASALIRGLISGCNSESPELNFAFDGDIFHKTWESFLT